MFSYTPLLIECNTSTIVYRKYPKIARLFRSNAPGLLNFTLRHFFVTLRENEENERKSAHDDRVRRCWHYNVNILFLWERLFVWFFFSFFRKSAFHILRSIYIIIWFVFVSFHEWNFYLLAVFVGTPSFACKIIFGLRFQIDVFFGERSRIKFFHFERFVFHYVQKILLLE